MRIRLKLSLLQPLVVLLLLAGVPNVEFERTQDGRLVRVVEAEFKPLWLHPKRSAASSRVEVKAGPDRLEGGDKTPNPAVGAPEASELGLDRARLIRISCVGYPTAPPSHRPCAAPPTGPPSLA